MRGYFVLQLVGLKCSQHVAVRNANCLPILLKHIGVYVYELLPNFEHLKATLK